MDFRSILEEALEAWAYTRNGVIEEARSLPEKDFGFRATEKSRSVIELLQHVIESGLLMSGELSRPDGDFRRKSYEGLLIEYARGISGMRSKRQLLAALRQTHTDGEKRIRAAGELHMFQLINRFDGKRGTRLARGVSPGSTGRLRAHGRPGSRPNEAHPRLRNVSPEP
jgi:hypothetical protein